MSNQYLLRHREDHLYAHFNPRTSEYCMRETTLGAIVFTEDGGQAFIIEAQLDGEWELVPLNPSDA